MIKVNINKASKQDLCKIIHIGEKRAGQIIAGRKFNDVHEISKVTGLGRIRMMDLIRQGYAFVKDSDFEEIDEKKPLK